jgi:ABC-type proline/glycine betaine transport system ATPase subunit
MKLLVGPARGLSVGTKILLMDEQFALCNIILAKQYYIDNYFKFIRISKKTILFVLTSCCDVVLRGRIALCL